MLFEDLVRAIRDCPFFHGMPPDEQMSLARLGGVDVQPAGGVLFRPGEVPAALYLVLDGVVEICREDIQYSPEPRYRGETVSSPAGRRPVSVSVS